MKTIRRGASRDFYGARGGLVSVAGDEGTEDERALHASEAAQEGSQVPSTSAHDGEVTVLRGDEGYACSGGGEIRRRRGVAVKDADHHDLL